MRNTTGTNDGHAILIVLILMTFLAALATAQFAVAQKNSQSAAYLRDYCALKQYADSGIGLAMHDLQHDLSGNKGKIGTVSWTVASDYGRDGYAGTLDEGEGDGVPTPGEPNVAPVSVGPSSLAAGLIVHVADSGFANTKRIVAVAANANATATVSTFVRSTPASLPKVAAMYVDPNLALDLKGNAFLIDGNDHKLDGTPLSGGAVPGIATAIGSPAGTNKTLLLSQIPSKSYDQIIGKDTSPSIGEQAGVDLATIFNSLKAAKTVTLTPGTYSNSTMGTLANPEFTYVSGDLQLSGNGTGAGALVVEGSVTFTGQFDFKGIVVVLGDIRLTGGGAGVHVYGSVLAGESFTAVDTTSSDVTLSGNADVYYSSEAISMVEGNMRTSYAIVYWDDQ